MSPIATDRPIAADTAQPRRADRSPEPEQRSRFEDALSRRDPKQEGKPTTEDNTPADAAHLGHGSHQAFDLMQGGSGQRDRGKRDQELGMLDGLRPAPTAAAPAQIDLPAPLPSTPVLAPSHAAFAARLDLPVQATGGEFQVSMSDTRWLASHAVVARDNAGSLSLDMSFNGDSNAEQQRAELRARLEARGHRVDRIDFAE